VEIIQKHFTNQNLLDITRIKGHNPNTLLNLKEILKGLGPLVPLFTLPLFIIEKLINKIEGNRLREELRKINAKD